MGGQTLTVLGSVLSFALLFGIYMMFRYDFAMKRKVIDEDEDTDTPLDL